MASDVEASDQFPEELPEGRWLSYDEIGRIRGIGRASAVKLVQRERWRRTKGNDGTARAFVPGNWLKPAGKRSREEIPELSQTINALGEAVAVLRKQLAAADGRVERAEQARDAAQTELATEKEARVKAEGRVEAEKSRADRAEAALREVEVARAAFWRRSRFARAWSAWTGRR